MASYSKDDLKRLGVKPRPIPAADPPVTAPPIQPLMPADPLPSADLRPILQQMSDTQRDTIQQLARSLQALKPDPARPCTLKIHRDARGYIDSIDLIPSE